MVVAGLYLRRIEVGAVGGGQHDLRGALAMYGGSTAYADQVLALAAPANRPADLAFHMSPSGVTNQCVAGALATWALMHTGDPRWNHPPPLFGNAIDLLAVARAQGFAVSSQPAPGRWWCTAARTGCSGTSRRW
jgi:hypothetical protein